MNIRKTVHMTGLKMRNNSPQLLFGAGIIGITSTVILACRATLKIVEVNAEHKSEIEKANDHIENQRYAPEVYKTHVVETWKHTSAQYVKYYGPSFVLGVVSIACLTKSHQILMKRNAGLILAYNGIDQMMKRYRARVVEELGLEKDTEFAHGKAVEVVDTGYDEEGNGKVQATKRAPADAQTAYGRWFDESNRHWDKHSGYNYNFLDNQQQWANLLLKKQGAVFLNEVYDLLGIERSIEGQQVGWTWDTDCGDGYIDFGFRRYPDFCNGMERTVFLDFNVDGPIMDFLDKR